MGFNIYIYWWLMSYSYGGVNGIFHDIFRLRTSLNDWVDCRFVDFTQIELATVMAGNTNKYKWF